MAAAKGFAQTLAKGPSYALAVTKDALNRETVLDLARALDHEAKVQSLCMQNANFREAYEAFKTKRDPRFV